MKPPAFSELPNEWTPVFPSSELRDKPVPFTLAGERLVFFRGAQGAAALLEQCPHRGVSLALGQVVDGYLQCPFHGWRFGADGACTHVPFNPGVATERLGTHAIPVREAAGLVWAYTGVAPTTEPVLPELAARPGARFGYLWEDWNTHWTRVMENMLDTPHLPFVHKGTIGAGIARRLGPTTKMEQTLLETPDGFDIRYKLDADPSDAMLQWIRPNGMVLHILDQPSRTMRIHVWCIPLAADRTRLLVAVGYDFGVFSALATLATPLNRKIVFEDRAVVESSQPPRVPSPKDESNVPTDKATLRFRTWYYDAVMPGIQR